MNYVKSNNYSDNFWILAWAFARSIPNSLSNLFFSSSVARTNFYSLLFSASCSSSRIFSISVFCLSIIAFISWWSCYWDFFWAINFSLSVLDYNFLFYFFGTTEIVFFPSVFWIRAPSLCLSLCDWFSVFIGTFYALVIETFWVVSIDKLFKSSLASSFPCLSFSIF